MTGIKAAPEQGAFSMPKQESKLDQVANLPRANQLGGAKTAAMSWVDVEKLVSSGRIDEVPKELLAQIHPDLAK